MAVDDHIPHAHNKTRFRAGAYTAAGADSALAAAGFSAATGLAAGFLAGVDADLAAATGLAVTADVFEASFFLLL